MDGLKGASVEGLACLAEFLGCPAFPPIYNKKGAEKRRTKDEYMTAILSMIDTLRPVIKERSKCEASLVQVVWQVWCKLSGKSGAFKFTTSLHGFRKG